MENQLVQSLLAQNDVRFPALPSTLVKINRVLKNTESSTHDLVVAISNPTIVVRLLQVANSPALRSQRHVASVFDAINLLGRAIVKNIVVCVTMRDLFSCRDLYLAKQLEGSWQHSVEIASIVAVLARRFKLSVDTAMSAGLLHDIGILPLVDYYERNKIEVGSFQQVAYEACQTLSESMLRKWDFPDSIVEATKGSNELPRELDKPTYFDLVAAAHYIVDGRGERLARLNLSQGDFSELAKSEERQSILKELS